MERCSETLSVPISFVKQSTLSQDMHSPRLSSPSTTVGNRSCHVPIISAINSSMGSALVTCNPMRTSKTSFSSLVIFLHLLDPNLVEQAVAMALMYVECLLPKIAQFSLTSSAPPLLTICNRRIDNSNLHNSLFVNHLCIHQLRG